MQPRTDLAVESSGIRGGRLKAIFQTIKTYSDIEIVKIEIKNNEEAKILNRPVGTYITISSKFNVKKRPIEFIKLKSK